MSDLYLRPGSGSDANNGSSYALAFQTFSNGATAARTAPGDRIKLEENEDPVSIGALQWTNKSDTLTSSSALTKDIELCNATWTAVSANVTQATTTTRKEGSNAIQFNVASGFTTGQIAYKTITSTDFSGQTKVCLWIQPNATVASGVLKIVLCSDTVGATPVNSFTLNEALAANVWRCITFNNGGALGSAIQSISFEAISDPGTVNIILDDIFATTDLTLTCLIGKSSSKTARERWPIKSVTTSGSVTTIKLGQGVVLSAAVAAKGYYGTTESVTTYKLEPWRITNSQSIQEAGSAGSPITYSGGWNRSDMTSQVGLTWLDVGDNSSACLTNSRNDISFEHLMFVRGTSGLIMASGVLRISANDCGAVDLAATGLNITGTNALFNLTNLSFYACNTSGIAITSNYSLISGVTIHSTGSIGITVTGFELHFKDIISNNSNTGITTTQAVIKIENFTVKDNSTAIGSASNQSNIEIIGFTSSSNGSGFTSNASVVKIDNTSTTESPAFITQAITSAGGKIETYRVGGDPAAASIFEDNATAATIVSSPVHGSATKSWKHSPTGQRLSFSPFSQPLSKLAVNDSGTVTISIWVQRSSQNVTGRLFLRGGQSNGVANDTYLDTTAANNTWEQLSITFSPTQKVPVRVELVSFYNGSGSTGDIYWSDMSQPTQV